MQYKIIPVKERFPAIKIVVINEILQLTNKYNDTCTISYTTNNLYVVDIFYDNNYRIKLINERNVFNNYDKALNFALNNDFY